MRFHIVNFIIFQTTSCPGQPCLTLAQLTDEFFDCFNSTCSGFNGGNVSLLFLSGFFTLSTDYHISGFNLAEYFINLAGFDNVQSESQPMVVINCTGEFGFRFELFDYLEISNIRFQNCGGGISVHSSRSFAMEHLIFTNSGVTEISSRNTVCGKSGNLISLSSTRGTLNNIVFSSDQRSCEDFSLVGVESGELYITNCEFHSEAIHIHLSGSNLEISGDVRFLNGQHAIRAFDSTVSINGNVTFQNGHNSAIQALNSTISLDGIALFINNTAIQGGALSLSSTHMSVAKNAQAIFQNNHARYVGGAIFKAGNDILNYISYGMLDPVVFGANSRVLFLENTADSGGSATYGVTVSFDEGSYESFTGTLDILPYDNSAVSSDPLRVCICPDLFTPDCLPDQNTPHLHYTVYPGQTFTIPVAVVGFNFAVTSGSVYAQFLDSDASLGSESQYVQVASQYGCTQLLYSVLSDSNQETLVLTSNGRSVTEIPHGLEESMKLQNDYFSQRNPTSNYYSVSPLLAGYVQKSLQDTPLFISLTLLDCPPGFTLSDQFYRCDCDERILQNHLTCNIYNQTVHREGTTWINASFSGNISNGVIINQHCPFGHCKQEPVDVDLTIPDTQCAFNRSGTLCGACKTNFSLALGGSQCLPNCSKSYLSLLIPFALTGFALVFLIKILNLTVSQGAINGLIFYANIVAANSSILFPVQRNKLLSFLSVFISWLNLDLGIETCFIKGLDGYWKTWLQFVFPFYLWIIAVGIILILRYSKRVAKIFGHNAASVLATLFFLSFNKILRSIIPIFSFTTLVYADNSTYKVWAVDGNITYLSSKHIPLFVFALAIILLLWLPYTAVLLSARWLRTQTHRKGLRWLKPFLNAYYSPFKDKHHYWVGVLLAVRGVLFICFASFYSIESSVNLLLISTSSILLVCASITGSLYKNVALGILENSFFVNLGMLATGTLYVRLVGGNQDALVTISVGIAFIQFIGIIAVHCYRFVKPSAMRCYNKYHRVPLGSQLSQLSSSEDGDDRPIDTPTQSESRLIELGQEELREPVQLQPHDISDEYQPQPVVSGIDINESTSKILHSASFDTTHPM